MSEWLKEHAWKACVGETLPWVRIPLSVIFTNCSNIRRFTINHLVIPDRWDAMRLAPRAVALRVQNRRSPGSHVVQFN